MVVKVLYVVSSLINSGPTNQLFNVIKYLPNDQFELKVVCLSKKEKNSRQNDFEQLGVEVEANGYSRLQGLLKNKAYLLSIIADFSPALIHTQGIRADSLLGSIQRKISGKWVLTSHNYPYFDYRMKFGFLKGSLMAAQHCKVQRQCQSVIACSQSIADQLLEVNIVSSTIRNGADSLVYKDSANLTLEVLERPVFVSVGSLISRKNIEYIIREFDIYKKRGGVGALVILGDGVERSKLQKMNVETVSFQGNVSNVGDYLAASDVFISASRAEGMPNTVLEALLSGLPCILSDIEPHKEIFRDAKAFVALFENDVKEALLSQIQSPKYGDKERCKLLAEAKFSAAEMSKQYAELYLSLVGDKR